MNEHEALAVGLRELAAWVENHPDLELPRIDVAAYPVSDPAQSPAIWARALGGLVEKDYGDHTYALFKLRRQFGPLELRVIYDRATVCRKIVKGTETVVIPAVAAKAERKVEREIVEWICEEPILAAAGSK